MVQRHYDTPSAAPPRSAAPQPPTLSMRSNNDNRRAIDTTGSRVYNLLRAGYFAHFFGLASISPYIGVVLKSKGFSSTAIGAIAAASPATVFFVVPPVMHLIESFGCQRQALLGGVIIGSFFITIFVLSQAHAVAIASFVLYCVSRCHVGSTYDEHVIHSLKWIKAQADAETKRELLWEEAHAAYPGDPDGPSSAQSSEIDINYEDTGAPQSADDTVINVDNRAGTTIKRSSQKKNITSKHISYGTCRVWGAYGWAVGSLLASIVFGHLGWNYLSLQWIVGMYCLAYCVHVTSFMSITPVSPFVDSAAVHSSRETQQRTSRKNPKSAQSGQKKEGEGTSLSNDEQLSSTISTAHFYTDTELRSPRGREHNDESDDNIENKILVPLVGHKGGILRRQLKQLLRPTLLKIHKGGGRKTRRFHPTDIVRVCRSNSHIPLFLTVFTLIGAGYAVINTFLFVFLQTPDLAASPILLGMSVVVTVSVEIPLFRQSTAIHKAYTDRQLLIGSMVAFILRVLGYSFLPSGKPWLVLLLEPLHGCTFGLTWLCGIHFLTNVFPEDLRNSAVGFLHASYFGLGQLVGAFAGGVIYKAVGPRRMFQLCAVLMTVVMIIFYWVDRVFCGRLLRRQQREDRTRRQLAEAMRIHFAEIGTDEFGDPMAQSDTGNDEQPCGAEDTRRDKWKRLFHLYKKEYSVTQRSVSGPGIRNKTKITAAASRAQQCRTGPARRASGGDAVCAAQTGCRRCGGRSGRRGI